MERAARGSEDLSIDAAGVFFAGDAAFGPKNIIWAVEQAHQAAISVHKHCQGEPIGERLAPGMNLQSRKMGMHEWSYANDYTPFERRLMPHVSLEGALQEARHRG
jgi:formate dehydrogenase beta subunit